MRAIFLLSFLLILSACDKEKLPELGTNLFDESSPDAFSIGDVEFEVYSPQKRNVRMNFTTNFDQLKSSQKNQIEFLIITKEGNSLEVFDISPTTTFIFDGQENLGTLCYLFRYKTFDGASTPFEKHCIEVQ